MKRYYERFRDAIARYADGVHTLGPPAGAAEVSGLPDGLADFLRSWNGAELFIDAISLYPAARVARQGGLVVFGATATGDRLALDGEGRVLRIEEDTGETLIEGTSFAKWLEGLVAAEGLLYDREGEFVDVFDDSGEELRPEIVEKRERRALKADPDAPAPAWRLARALEKQDRLGEARKLLGKVVAAWPGFAWAWFDRGRLLRGHEDSEAAEQAFQAAAEADPEYEHAGYFMAHAARTAAERKDEAARAKHAARALELDPELARAQREAAASLLAEGDQAGARQAAELAAALAPRDVAVMDLLRRLR